MGTPLTGSVASPPAAEATPSGRPTLLRRLEFVAYPAAAGAAFPLPALGFGSPARGTALLGAVISAVLLSLVVPLGPLLLGPSVPVLLALSFADPRRHTS